MANLIEQLEVLASLRQALSTYRRSLIADLDRLKLAKPDYATQIQQLSQAARQGLGDSITATKAASDAITLTNAEKLAYASAAETAARNKQNDP